MHRRGHSWSSLSLIKQLCDINHATIQSLSTQSSIPPVQPDVPLLNFLQTGWDHYLPELLDHHPCVDTRSTENAPRPYKLLAALTPKSPYAYSADIAIDFNNLLTSFLIAYLIRLDYVDRALRKLKGRAPSNPRVIGSLFDGLSVAIRAVFVISHSKAMAAHMSMLSNSLRLPEDHDASDSLSFFSALIINHSERNEEAKIVAPNLKPHSKSRRDSSQNNAQDGNSDGLSSFGPVPDNSWNSCQKDNSDDPSSRSEAPGNENSCQEDYLDNPDNLDDNTDNEAWATELIALPVNKNNFEQSGTPWAVICRRWIMSLVDHFTSIRVLERACVRLPKNEEITFSLLGVDHRRATLPEWEIMEDFLRRLTYLENKHATESYITYLKNCIKGYKTGSVLPGTTARCRDSVILPFQDQLNAGAGKALEPQIVTTCLHCEATLIAVMTYLSADSKHELGQLLQVCSSPSTYHDRQLTELCRFKMTTYTKSLSQNPAAQFAGSTLASSTAHKTPRTSNSAFARVTLPSISSIYHLSFRSPFKKR